ncbi:MAG: WS/DGAT domain-containing protein, partial [Myxococcota bacterium]
GDGVTLVQLLLALTDHAEAEPRAVGLAMPERPHGVVAFGRAVVEHGTALARMTLLPGDASTVLRGELGPKKRVAWTRTFALSALREVARAHQAKLNDVLMAATAGALRRYLEGRSGLPSVAELRAMVPVFLRGHDTEGGALGNHFGLVFLPLLIGVADPHERVRASKLANDRVKGSADAVVALEVLAAMGAAGPGVESIGIDIFTRKASCMITNVPGPTTALRLAGRPVANLIVWAPVAGHIGTGISLVTYDGKVRVGVCSDARLVPDPDRIARAWEAEVELLVGGLAQS